MGLADELSKLEELHRKGALSDEEFAQAKAAALAGGGASEAPALAEHLAELRRQNELARVDREWAVEREKYMLTGQDGRRQIPTPGASVAMAVLVGAFGVLWTVIAISMTAWEREAFGNHPAPPGFGPPAGFGLMSCLFPLFGVLFTCFGVGMGVRAYSKAKEYEQALARYQRRRREVAGAGAKPDRPPGDERITAGPPS